ncbi:DNA phosphorothioation system sulfurtransferase DndC [Leucothrix sargassi]|nr:DNA phosphorothioation system sulfurtransferase DndC [Leucothrix sargassi]
MASAQTFIYETHEQLISELVINDRPLQDVCNDIAKIYLSDNRPWLIGFSGGKDSTAVLSLIYSALLSISPEKRHKHIYVVSSDTLVETPVVVDLIGDVLGTINKQAKIDNISMTAHPVFPKMDQTFWVNLLGKGYPAPQQSFRWCTERMKIDPVSDFIKDKVAKHGEVIVALGSRSQESASRAQTIASHNIEGSPLSRHSSLPNAYTYMPIVDWSADDVWEYLISAPCPYGGDNWKLFDLYKGSNQGECPLVIDTNTPSCGNSRFGCWTCTVVTEDKALHGLIESGDEWMRPLLDFRNELHRSTKPENKSEYRNFKRRTGKVTYMREVKDDDKKTSDAAPEVKKHVPGPYWMKQRQDWVRHLLETEKSMNDQGHDISLIKFEELKEIRQQWLTDPNEPDWMDTLPKIYADVYGDTAEWVENDLGTFTNEDVELLRELSAQHGLSPELVMKLVETEIEVTGLGKRRGVIAKLETLLSRDWESLEEIKARHSAEAVNPWKDKLNELSEAYERASAL